MQTKTDDEKMEHTEKTRDPSSVHNPEALHKTNLVKHQDDDNTMHIVDFLKPDKSLIDEHDNSEIAAFYKGRSILITGASGFVGKCLLEKLLRSCPGIEKIYVLLRPKRGVGVKERLEALKKSELFYKLRDESRSHQLNKIIPVEGDITKPNFGLVEEDIRMLSDDISLIFHSAATVKFAELLNVAVTNNVVSVENLVCLASRMKNLKALVHVSTAYSNCDRRQVDEIFYDPPINADKLIDMASWMDPNMLEKICPLLLGDRPNTYTYTKAVAESLLVEKSKKLIPNVPIAMVRPSIVAGVWRQPILGWVDNFNGPTGVILSLMTGALQAMLARPGYCADIVPVDVVANLIICTAWQILQHDKKAATKRLQESATGQDGNISVFNCVSGTLNPVFWRKIAERMDRMANVYPCEKMMRSPQFLLIPNEHLFNVYNFFNHTTVAYLGDFFLKSVGKKTTLVVIYKRLMKMIQILKPFTMNQWLFKCTNVTTLYDSLSTVDKSIFNFDVRQIAWDDYMDRYCLGAKLYAMKDSPKKLSGARQKLRQRNNMNRAIQIMFLLFAYFFLISGTALERYVIESFSQISPFSLKMFNTQSGINAAVSSKDLLGIAVKGDIG